MGITALSAIKLFMWNGDAGIVVKAFILAGVISLCIGIYLLIMYLVKSEELKYLVTMIKKKEIS